MAFSVIKPVLVLCLLHRIQIFVHGKHHSAYHDHPPVFIDRPFMPVRGTETERQVQNPSTFGQEHRRLESVEIRALMKSKMKVDHVEVRCQGLQKGLLVKDFEYVVLKPGEEHIWSAEQRDLSPDRVICIMFWKKLYLIYDIYYNDHNDLLISEWDIDESGLNSPDGSGYYLVQTWREQKA